MPKGTKTDSKTIAKVLASYAFTNSYNKTAKECGISDKTAKKIVLEHPKEYEQKKEDFYTQADNIIDKAMLLLSKRFDTALEKQNEVEALINMCFSVTDEDEELTRKEKLDIARKLSRLELNNLSEITTAIGTLFDKKRLEKGESTTNNAITIKMSDEVSELSQ